MNIQITVSEEIRRICPEFRGAALTATVTNTSYEAGLWEEINRLITGFQSRYTPDSIKNLLPIAATREAYKRCGKDPSRYRPSNEALARRILRGLGLYQINTMVDLVNLCSIAYGYSIGGFDRDKIAGNQLVLGIGRTGEPYEGIGRGTLNIEHMPVYRDERGGIGTPTSDHERTKMALETTRFLGIVNGYDGNRDRVLDTISEMRKLITAYCHGTDFEVQEF